MDPLLIIEAVAGVISRVATVAGPAIQSIEGAKPVATAIIGLFKTDDVTPEALNALIASTHGLTEQLLQPVPDAPTQDS